MINHGVFGVLVLSSVFLGTFSGNVWAADIRQAGPAASVIPNFHAVTRGIYRGARPLEAGIRELADHHIRTIIDIDDDSQVSAQEDLTARQLGIHHIWIPLNAFGPVDVVKVNQILSILNDTNAQPIFLHCHYGRDRTGMIMGIYRVEDMTPHWTPQAAYQEMLNLGFRPALVNLDHYFKQRTHF